MFFLLFAACSKPLSDGVFSQFTSSDSCIRAAFKREACSFASQSDTGLTPSNRFWDSVRVRDFWGLQFFIFCIAHPEMNLAIWVMIIFEHSCKRGKARRPWEGAILIVRMKDWNWEMKTEMEGGREQDLDQREESFKWNWKHMKSEGFFLYLNAHLLATSYNRPSEWDSEHERQGKSKATWKEIETHLSFLCCNSQSPKSSSLESLTCFFLPLCLVFIRAQTYLFWSKKKFNCILNANSSLCNFFLRKEMVLRSRQHSISYSVAA